MGAEFLSDAYVKDQRHGWDNVVELVVRRKGIAPDDAKAKRQIALKIMTARNELGFAAQKLVGPKAKKIVDYHILVGSTPPMDMVTREHFTGLSSGRMMGLVARHVITNKPSQDIMEAARPYFERGSPDRRYAA